MLSLGIIPLCVPPLIVALANISCFGVSGIFSNGKPWLYSTLGIVMVQGFYNFPLITGIVAISWGQTSQDQENAARLLGAKEGRIFFTISIKRLSGAIAAGCIPVFLFCFFSFMIVLLFSPAGHTVLEVEIYRSIRNTLELKSGALLAVLETGTALGLVAVYSIICRKSQTTSDGIDFAKNYRYKLGQKPYASTVSRFFEVFGFIVLTAVIIIFFFCPAISIIISSFVKKIKGIDTFSFSNFSDLFKSKNFGKSFVNTIWIGCCTGLLSTIIGFIYSVIIKIEKKSHSVLLQTIPLLPMAISSVVIGWTFTMIFHRGNIFMLILIQTLLYWPIAYRQIQNGINKINKDTVSAALLFSKNKADAVLRVFFPSARPVLFSSFGFCFAMSAGDATLPLVLSIPQFNTMAFYTYRLANSYKFNQACAAGGLLSLICILVYVISANSNR